MNQNGKTLYIVTGISASLGGALLSRFMNKEGALCYGVYNSSMPSGLTENRALKLRQCNLLNRSSVSELVKQLALDVEEHDITKVVLTHAVGPFKYEGSKCRSVKFWKENGEWEVSLAQSYNQEVHGGYVFFRPRDWKIDQDVWDGNVRTFSRISTELVESMRRVSSTTGKPINVVLGTYGSVTEPYKVPLWYSFILAKMQVLSNMKEIVRSGSFSDLVYVQGFYLRTSTIDACSERDLRPSASDRTRAFWLQPGDIVDTTEELICSATPGIVEERDLICRDPAFDLGYYNDIVKIAGKWEQEMTPN